MNIELELPWKEDSFDRHCSVLLRTLRRDMASTEAMDAVLRYFRVILPSQEIQEKLDEWLTTSVSVNILVSGKTGTGKSTLINGILGKKVCEEGGTLDPQTSEVKLFQTRIGEVQVNVFDTPGLQDGTTREAEYLKDIKAKCEGVTDLLIYCIDMSKARYVRGGREIEATRKLTAVLGNEIWENALFVLTFANRYINEAEDKFDEPEEILEEFHKRKELWTTTIRAALRDEVGVDADIAERVQVIPAGHANKPQLLPESEYWMSNLWFEALFATKVEAQPALIKINQHRFATDAQVDPKKFKAVLAYQPIVCANMGKKFGMELGVKNYHLGAAVGFSAGTDNSLMMILTHLAARNHFFSMEDLLSRT